MAPKRSTWKADLLIPLLIVVALVVLLWTILDPRLAHSDTTLRWTNPGLARSAVPCADSVARANLTQIDIYRAAVGGTGQRFLLRSHLYALATPPTDSLMVPDSPAATYWVIPVNAAGASECEPRGWTVGVPTTGVELTDRSDRPGSYIDLAGRVVRPPFPRGIYFERMVSGVRRVVVVR